MGDGLQQILRQALRFFPVRARRVDQRRPLANRIGGAFETEPQWIVAAFFCGVEHERTNQVVRDQIQRQFLLHHVGRLAFERVHARRNLDVAQEKFDVPASAVEFGKMLLGKPLRIEQRGFARSPVLFAPAVCAPKGGGVGRRRNVGPEPRSGKSALMGEGLRG